MPPKSTNAEALDRLLDGSSDEIDQYTDCSSARRINEVEQVIVELTAHLVGKRDAIARRAGASRQLLVERWIASEAATYAPLAA